MLAPVVVSCRRTPIPPFGCKNCAHILQGWLSFLKILRRIEWTFYKISFLFASKLKKRREDGKRRKKREKELAEAAGKKGRKCRKKNFRRLKFSQLVSRTTPICISFRNDDDGRPTCASLSKHKQRNDQTKFQIRRFSSSVGQNFQLG
jgi:hypothetical protein